MTCLRDNENGADLLIGFLEGSLAEPERTALLAHAAACRECGELLAVQSTLDAFEAPEVSPNFDAQLYARIAAERKPWWAFSGWKMAIPAAMAAMLAVGVWIQRPEPVEDTGQKQASVQDVKQLEQALEDLELLMPVGSTDTL
ncbi:MAG: hypothetical protein RL328_433 [Acidobacteriota bacterium]